MEYERFVLPNGLRVLCAPMPTMRSVSSAVFIGVGSRFESDSLAGAAHLVEHLMFKGTRRRPTSRQISETIERIGGVINAATDKEATVYWTKTAAQHLPISIDLLADMLQFSRLTPRDVARERTVIVEELGMSMDDPQDWVHNLVDEAMWPGHPVGRDVAGTRESVLGLRRPGLRRFLGSYYGSTNAILVVAGGVQPREVRELAAKHFSEWKRSEPRSFLPRPTSGGATAFAWRSERPNRSICAWPIPGWQGTLPIAMRLTF